MLRMSKLTDYGIVLMTHMAMGADRPIQTAQALAKASRVPLPTVSKILKELSRAGLVVSHRGRRGGYGLARRPEAIAVSEIIAALEGPVALTECSETAGACLLEPDCPAASHWGVINHAIQQALDGLTLSSLQPRPIRIGAPSSPATAATLP
jgi:FeS assembly SUF system regulator